MIGQNRESQIEVVVNVREWDKGNSILQIDLETINGPPSTDYCCNTKRRDTNNFWGHLDAPIHRKETFAGPKTGERRQEKCLSNYNVWKLTYNLSGFLRSSCIYGPKKLWREWASLILPFAASVLSRSNERYKQKSIRSLSYRVPRWQAAHIPTNKSSTSAVPLFNVHGDGDVCVFLYYIGYVFMLILPICSII
ncbi:hypothetical protein DID88_000652 [Monilinia fructigena]|uniref:Uncharacterized protein n=1 Tax=Monilinia fructigena TaxID=38457 RepID=A0A395IIK9_9HELO|nr:hypothetical protein DID88_000652 [Monilinia fructigena]